MGVNVALLRGINVGGANRLPMADLRSLAEREGLGRPRTLLQSGNLIFDGGDGPEADIERRLETVIARELGLTVDVMVRSAESWRGLIEANPLPDAARDDPGHLLAVILKSEPVQDAEARLRAVIVGPETARFVGREVFIHYVDGVGDSRLTQAVIDRALGTRGTARNWNTVLKIANLAASI